MAVSSTHTVIVMSRERRDIELDWLSGIHLDMRARECYGKVVLTYAAGKIIQIDRNEVLKPD